ncbi:MAG TPA: patatin-like phospholipase family protein [Acidimicrobiales bacterium]|nr:patatin-like phospholipase family protein [Acidimicrobiales bacterium]
MKIGLVLGAGGVAGVAFHAGVLAALAERTGFDARDAELVMGTSAGSVTASGLRAGLAPADMLARACDEPMSPEGTALMAPVAATTRGTVAPGRFPAGFPAAPAVLLAAARRPGRVRPGAVVAGLLPAGVVPTDPIAAGVDALFGDRWPERPTWICAVRLETGRLTVFGRDGAPHARMGEAVAASCAIPGYFTPVTIGGVRYVDGGVHSLTNLAKVRSLGLDLVVVSAPMARTGPRRPGLGSVGREFSRLQLAAEARRIRSAGTPVIAFSPTHEDQAVIGSNPMDPSRQAAVARQVYASTLRRLERPDIRARFGVHA